MQKSRHVVGHHADRRAVIRLFHQNPALRRIRAVERVSVAHGNAAARQTRLIRAVHAVFGALPLAVVRRGSGHLRRHRVAGVQPRLRGAARRAVRRQPVRLLKLPNGLCRRLVISAAYKRGGQVPQCRQSALHLPHLFAAHARRQHVGYRHGIRCARQLVADAHAVCVQRVARINQLEGLRPRRAVHLQVVHRLEGLRRLHGLLVEFAGHIFAVQIAQLDQPLLILAHVVAFALPLDHRRHIRHGCRRNGRRAARRAEIRIVTHRASAVQDGKRAAARHAVRPQPVRLLEELDRALRSRAELPVRRGAQIAQRRQIALHHFHLIALVAAPQHGVRRLRLIGRLRLVGDVVVGRLRRNRIAAVQLVHRALARYAVRAQPVRLLEGLDRRRRLAGIAPVDAPVVIAQFKQPRLQGVYVLARVALAHGAVAARLSRRGGRFAASVQLLERACARRTVRRQAVSALECRQRVLRLRAEYAVRHAAQIVQLDQPLLQGVNVVARHADRQRARLIRVRRRHRAGRIFRAGGIQLRLRLAARLPVAAQAVRPLEGLDRAGRRRAVNAVHAARVIAQLGQPPLQLAHIEAGRALLEQRVAAVRRARADRLGLRRRGIELVLRGAAGDAVRRQAVSALEFRHGALRAGGVFAVNRAGIIAQLGQPRLQIAHVAARRADAEHGIARVVILRGGLPALRARRDGRRRFGRRRRQAAAGPILPRALVAGLPRVRRGGRRVLRHRGRRIRRQRLHRAERNRPVADLQRIERRVG